MRKGLLAVLGAAVLASSVVAADKLSGAGATFPAPLYYDWAHSYEAKTHNQVNYQAIGSGGGIKQIQKRTVDFGGTDKPLTPQELAKDNLLQFPAVVGTINVVYNIPGVADGAIKLSNEAVAGIFLGTINSWNDPIIKKDNPGVNLPAGSITVVHRSDGSGTTWNFAYWLDKISTTWKSKVGVGTSVNWPKGIGGKGNEGVANIVKQTPNSIGYVEFAYAKQNKMTSAQLQTSSKTWVAATVASSKEAAKGAKWTKADHFHEILVLEPGKGAYPITAATFILLPKEKVEQNKKVVAFFNYAFENDAAAEKLGYIPLPNETVKMIQSYFKDNGL
ncbi:MAG: phosphate ABC transporter substrate-binding protein PstS [Campylobacterales bacterium]|nr:phosphate ABC transporter substrate-binding protein PstS [Campylobacterales bacterium]